MKYHAIQYYYLLSKIVDVKSNVDAADGWYRVTQHTTVKFDFNSPSVKSEVGSSSSSRSVLSFAGYEQQKQACLHHATLALQDTKQSESSSDHKPSFFEQQLLRPPKGLLLYGPPGTGKTRLMHCIVQSMGCHYVEITPSILLTK